MRIIWAATLAMVLPASIGRLTAAELKKETVDEFNRYVAAAEERINRRHEAERFLWSDELPQSQRDSLLHGEIVIEGAPNSGTIEIRNGLIHDWWGAIFIPGTTLDKTINVVQDYSRHNIIYKPEIAAARMIRH